jgi:rhomboid family GlyGly-CTERM serine protease
MMNPANVNERPLLTPMYGNPPNLPSRKEGREDFHGKDSISRSSHWPEFLAFGIALAVLNFPLLKGDVFHGAVFHPASVHAGEWWRVVTHPFVHLSWYHLLLDAGAFLLLYGGLDEPSRSKRMLYITGCGLGSLTLSAWTAPVLHTQGLCGLSGVAHGLMAVSALESIWSGSGNRKLYLTGLVTLAIVVIKSIIEVMRGRMVFEFLHFGMMGVPVPECHLGGVLSGVVVFFLCLPPSKRVELKRML